MTLARIELFRQIGQAPDATLELSDSIDSIAPVPTQTIVTVLASRADVAAAREAVSMAQQELRLQKALGVPDLDLLAGYKRNSGDDTLYTGLQIQLPFTNRNQGEVSARKRIFGWPRISWSKRSCRFVPTSRQRKKITRDRRTLCSASCRTCARAQKNLSIMSDAYKTGGIDLLRYIDAERTAIDVEVSALRALAAFQQSALQLTLAYGGRP